jgi:Zn-dependent protease with chaperone function
MRIRFKQPRRTADINAARGSAFSELWKLIVSAVVLMVGLYFLWGIVVNAVVAGISFETEAKLFRHLEPPQPQIDDPAAGGQLKRAAAILKKLQSVHGIPPLPYRIVLIDQDAPNAFAIPGGSIGVTRGLFDALGEEIEIAFVIGHELGHFKNRDHLQGLGRAAGYSMMAAVLFNVGAGSESFGDTVRFVMERSYSQDREIKADRFGLELVHAAYGRVKGTERLFKLLLDGHALPDWAYMFSTHPSPQSRIMALKSYGDRLMQEKNHLY